MNGDKLKIYSIVITIVAAIFLAAIVVLLIMQNQPDKASQMVLASTEAESSSEETTEAEIVDTKESQNDETEETSTDESVSKEKNEEESADKSKLFNVGNIVDPEDDKSSGFYINIAWQNMLSKLDYDADIAFYGDSIVMHSDFRAYFPDKKIVNLGIGGQTLIGARKWAYSTTQVHPEKVFIMCGINSLRDDNVEECTEEYKEILDEMLKAVPNAEIYVHSVLPIDIGYQEGLPCSDETIRTFNGSIEQLANERGMTYVDLYSSFVLDGAINPELSEDGVHINSFGYDIWANIISEYIY